LQIAGAEKRRKLTQTGQDARSRKEWRPLITNLRRLAGPAVVAATDETSWSKPRWPSVRVDR